MNRPILSICIPTYNRAENVGKLLEFIDEEIDRLDNNIKIEILLSNNCSDDNTESVVKQSKIYNQLYFSYFRQTQNIGAIPNMIFLWRKASGDYIWTLGDDDIYYEGMIGKILNECQSKYYAYIFINHRIINNDGILKETQLDTINVSNTDKDELLSLFHDKGTCMMFISATIHKREFLLESIKENLGMVTPLYASFYSASKGPVKFYEEQLVADYLYARWSNKIFAIFYFGVPTVLFKLFKLGYNNKRLLEIIFSYIWKRKKGYLRYYVNRLRGKKLDVSFSNV